MRDIGGRTGRAARRPRPASAGAAYAAGLRKQVERIDGVSRSLPYSDLLALTSSHTRWCDELITAMPMTLWLCVVTHEQQLDRPPQWPDRTVRWGQARGGRSKIEAHPGYVAGR